MRVLVTRQARIGLAAATLASICAASESGHARGSGLYDFNQYYGGLQTPPPAPPQVVPVQPVVPAAPPPPSLPVVQAQPAAAPQPAGARRAEGIPAASAFTEKGPYVRIDLGYSVTTSLKGDFDNDVDDSAVIDFGIGYRFSPYVRFDTTLAVRGFYDKQIKGEKVEVQNALGLLNLYWDVFRVGSFSPYLMGGIGLAYNNLDTIKRSGGNVKGDSNGDFAWTLGAGLSYHINHTMSLDLGYRYIDAGEVRSAKDADADNFGGNDERLKGQLRSHDFMIGLRNHF